MSGFQETRRDQLAPGEHVRDMGSGWVVLSAEFLGWGLSLASPDPNAPPPAKQATR